MRWNQHAIFTPHFQVCKTIKSQLEVLDSHQG